MDWGLDAMETIFLSYTYRPHPDHERNLEQLHRCVVRAVEAMGLRIIDGVDVGGRALDDALRKRIADADALIALLTPQVGDAGGGVNPAFVLSEFQYAEGQGKPTIRILHDLLVMGGLGAGNEYIPYQPGKEVEVLLKLMNTIVLWRREHGQRARVRIEPADLTKRYDEGDGYRCEFKVISQNGIHGDFQRARLAKEPGAAYAVLPKLRQGDRVLLRFRQGDKTWQAPDVIDPFVGGVRLEEQP
jgi:hypothetical protein